MSNAAFILALLALVMAIQAWAWAIDLYRKLAQVQGVIDALAEQDLRDLVIAVRAGRSDVGRGARAARIHRVYRCRTCANEQWVCPADVSDPRGPECAECGHHTCGPVE